MNSIEPYIFGVDKELHTKDIKNVCGTTCVCSSPTISIYTAAVVPPSNLSAVKKISSYVMVR